MSSVAVEPGTVTTQGVEAGVPSTPFEHLGIGPTSQMSRRLFPRRTVRLRLSLLYGGLFLLSGAGLLGMTYALVAGDPVAPLLSASVRAGGLVVARGAKATSKTALIQVVASADHAAQLHGLLIWSAVALCIMTVGSVWLGWLVAGRVLRPVRTITTTTRQISEENLSERLALKGPDDELKELGDTIDALLARLERSFDAQRSFVANASHELRTPLTIVRAALDVARRKTPPVSEDAAVLASKVRVGLEQAERLVESFLLLAHAQRGAEPAHHQSSLATFASQALGSRYAEIAERHLSIETAFGEAQVSGNEVLLARMIANIVDNAVRYSPIGGHVRLQTETDGRLVLFAVENDGPYFEQGAVELLVQPFRRLSTERTGSRDGVGLGLSIVDAIATTHGGKLELLARNNGGLRVAVELPSALSPTEVRER